MIEYRLAIDLENLRLRLSRDAAVERSVNDVLDWLASRRIDLRLVHGQACFVAADEAIDHLRPWEVLERLPLLILPESDGFHLHQ